MMASFPYPAAVHTPLPRRGISAYCIIDRRFCQRAPPIRASSQTPPGAAGNLGCGLDRDFCVLDTDAARKSRAKLHSPGYLASLSAALLLEPSQLERPKGRSTDATSAR